MIIKVSKSVCKLCTMVFLIKMTLFRFLLSNDESVHKFNVVQASNNTGH